MSPVSELGWVWEWDLFPERWTKAGLCANLRLQENKWPFVLRTRYLVLPATHRREQVPVPAETSDFVR